MTEAGFWHLSVFHVSKERFSVISRSAALVRVITLLYLQRTCSFGVADSKATLQCACVLRAGWEKKGCYRDKLLNSVLLGSLLTTVFVAFSSFRQSAVVIERTSEVLFACRPIDSSSLQASHSQVNIHKLKPSN